MSISPPPVDKRKQSEIVARLKKMVPHFTPEWSPSEEDPGTALINIFAFLTQQTLDRLNQAPLRNMLAFLDLLGVRLAPKTPAQAFLRFNVTEGTLGPVDIPARTLATAASDSGPVPFETDDPIRANPGKLLGLFSVDPENDAIRQPPRGFLDKKFVELPAPEYETATFSSAGSQSIQLQLVDGIELGDTLRIGANDFVVADTPQGLIVPLQKALPVAVDQGSKVLKRTTFELFTGINLQDHILFLSHPDYFKLKQEAVITLSVKVTIPGNNTEVVWEFLTEDAETKAPKLAELTVLQDDTNGLSRSGIIQLLKPEGEITEGKVGEQTGRWIRARRANPIALTDRLSTLDFVRIQVSARNTIQADAAFYNESPLTVKTPPFYPFGFEPQLFDRFQIASTEAFSKPGAQVILDFNLDQGRLLGAPALAVGPSQVPRIFARGVLTRLVEVAFSPTAQFFERKNPLLQIAPGAIPAAVAEQGSDRVGVFVRCQDQGIQLFLSPSTTDGGWVTLDKPGGSANVMLDPAAVRTGSQWVLFAVVDKKLWQKTTSASAGAGADWKEVALKPELVPSSAPAAALDSAPNPVVFVFDDKNNLWRVGFSSVGGVWQSDSGKNLSAALLPDDEEYQCKLPASAHPFAVDAVPGKPDPAAFFLNKFGDIVAIRDTDERGNLGQPDGGAAADPSAIFHAGPPDQFLVFAPSISEGRLCSATIATDLTAPSSWKSRPNPQPVASRPAAASVFDTQYRVLVTSTQGSMLRLTVRPEKGNIKAASDQLIFLSQSVPLSSAKTRYVRLNPASRAEMPQELENPFPSQTVAVLASPLVNPVPRGTRYHLLEWEEDLKVAGASTKQIVTLTPSTALSGTDLWLSIGGANPEVVPIQSVAPGGGSVDLGVNPLQNLPAATTDCSIFRWLYSGTTSQEASEYVLLDAQARPEAQAYDGADIKINSSTIAVLQCENRIAKLQVPFTAAVNDAYEFPEQWAQIQDPALDDIDPSLSWEYWNGTGWVNLQLGKAKDLNGVELAKDETNDLINSGRVSFIVPPDIAATEIAGQTNYWLRARLVGGNYGQVKFEAKSHTDDNGDITFTTERKDFSRPPIVAGDIGLTIQYALTDFKDPKILLTLNNLDYLDQTAASITVGKTFQPFFGVDNQEKTIYFGLEKSFSDPSILLALQQDQPVDETRKLLWEAWSQIKFKAIEVKDESGAMTHTGLVLPVAPFPPEERQLFGIPAYWIRARLLKQDWTNSPELSGVFLNVARVRQLQTFEAEILGSSDGTPNQTFTFQNTPVYEQEVRVRSVLTDEDRKRIQDEAKDAGLDPETVVVDRLDQNGSVIETWVLWQEQEELFDSKYDSRHYRLDHASGELEFGDGRNGAVPPIGGGNIRAFFYRAGGGEAGNVKVDTIQSLVSAIAGIDAVSNPLPAGGGSDQATREQMLDLGPAQFSHQDRAVSPTDYEWLTLQASRDVVKVRCVPNRDDAGLYNPGWVTLYIVARSEEAQPLPSWELCSFVRSELLKHVPALVAWPQQLFVGRPKYLAVNVTVTVSAKTAALAPESETETRKTLNNFLHPLTGGPDGTGWEFGQGLSISALYSEIEKISAVDHVEQLEIDPRPTRPDYLELNPDQILASGDHVISTIVVEESL